MRHIFVLCLLARLCGRVCSRTFSRQLLPRQINQTSTNGLFMPPHIVNWTLSRYTIANGVKETPLGEYNEPVITDYIPTWSPFPSSKPLNLPNSTGDDSIMLNIGFDPSGYSRDDLSTDAFYDDDYFSFLLTTYISDFFTSVEDIVPLYNITFPFGEDLCPGQCSSMQDCIPIYRSLGPGAQASDMLNAFLSDGPTNTSLKPLSCPIAIVNVNAINSLFLTCQQTLSYGWLNQTDSDLRSFVSGGIDSIGVLHDVLGNSSLSSSLKGAYTEGRQSSCTLESVCEAPTDCTQVGTLYDLSDDPQRGPRLRSGWAYLVLIAIANINQQLSNQYQALQSAAIQSSLAAFTIDDYYPKPSNKIAIKDIITGLSTVLAAVSGFIPFLGPEIVAVEVAGAAAGSLSAIASGAGTYFERGLANNVGRSDPNVVQKTFAPVVRQIFQYFSEGLDNLTTSLLRGEQIEGAFDILMMMQNGTWLDSSSLTRIADAQVQLENEILSRGINSLWKKPPSNSTCSYT